MPTQHSTIAGLLFDFMGYLTSRDEVLHLSGRHNATPAVKAIEEFAARRGMNLTHADVQHWQDDVIGLGEYASASQQAEKGRRDDMTMMPAPITPGPVPAHDHRWVVPVAYHADERREDERWQVDNEHGGGGYGGEVFIRVEAVFCAYPHCPARPSEVGY